MVRIAHRSVDVLNRAFRLIKQSGNVRWFGARQSRSRRGDGRARSARAYREEPVADNSFGSNGDHRISAHQSAQLLADPNLDLEFCWRRIRDVHTNHLSCIHAGNLNLRALRDTGKIGKFSVELDMTGEGFVPIADHE